MNETLSEQIQADILRAMLDQVVFEGWTRKALMKAVETLDLPKGAEALYFPGGVLEIIEYWSAQCDQRTDSDIRALELETMRIRERITEAVWLRLNSLQGREQAAQRAMARLTLPDAVIKEVGGQGARQLWATAHMIWRAIGDTSTDGNFYSKRAILSGVIGSALPVWLSDESEDKAKARAFLEARIENVMQFEKLKWDMRKKTEHVPNPAEVLGRLRYGKFRRRRS